MSRRGRAAALAVLVATAACGLKNDPLPPGLVRPLPPAAVTAKATAEGVVLAWRRPTAYTGGGRMRDLAGFDVERAAVPTGPFALAGTLDLTDQQRFRQERNLGWTDTAVTAGAEYFYRVTAFTTDGSRSDPSPVVTIRFVPPARRETTDE